MSTQSLTAAPLNAAFQIVEMRHQPRGHEAAVAPAAEHDTRRIDDAEFLYCRNACHHIAPGAIAGVHIDRALIGIAAIVAAAVIGWNTSMPRAAIDCARPEKLTVDASVGPP